MVVSPCRKVSPSCSHSVLDLMKRLSKSTMLLHPRQPPRRSPLVVLDYVRLKSASVASWSSQTSPSLVSVPSSVSVQMQLQLLVLPLLLLLLLLPLLVRGLRSSRR